MTNTKNTKRALLSSVVALFLCFSMLLGTTFAWFTDSITNGVNKIVSGNLDVELWHNTGAAAAANSKWGLFFGYSEEKGEEVKSDTALFLNQDGKPILWEPGATAVENFRIKNAGSLALKFQFKLEVANATKTEAGKDLSDIIELYIDKLTYDENGVPSGTELVWGRTLDDGYIIEGELLPGENYDFWVGLEWEPSDIDNEYNVKNGLSLDLGVTLLATQLSYEKDDINGNEYDKDAWVEGMVVADESSLKTALRRGEKNIVLMKDIELAESLVIPASSNITIDLNGKTLTGTFHKNNGAVVMNNGTLTINGGTISSTAANGGSAIQNAGTLTVNNATLNGAPNADGSWPSYAVNNTGKMTVNDSHITSVHGAVSSYGANAELTLNNTNIAMSGIPGFTSHGIYTYNDGVVVVNGGNIANNAVDQNATGASVINGKVTINNGSFSGRIENYYGTPVIKGGTFSANPARFVAAGYEAVKNSDGTYTVIFPQNSFDSLIDNAQAGDTVEVPAGTYTFPASKLEAGVTLNCAPGTVFDGKTSLNIKGATVVGATFTSNNAYLVNQQTINGTFKDCVFTNSDGLRSCIAGETVVFENCVFDTDFYGVHFDSGKNDVVFKGCTFTGFNTFGAALTKLTMEDCTFKYNGKGGYNGINLWGNAELTNCTFVFDGSASYEWVDLRGDNKTVTFTNCVVTDGKTEKGIETVVGNSGKGNTIIVDGVNLATNNDMLKAAIANGETKVVLANGEYDLNGIQKNGLTLVGVGNDVKVANTTKYAGGKAVGAITKAINLENVTITNTVYTMENGGDATFTKVTFAAGFRQGYGKNVKFTNCVFGSNSEGYALHFQTDPASEGGKITLEGCEFEGGKVHLGGKRAYEFIGCDFAKGTDFQVWSNVTLEGCAVDGVAVTDANVATLFTKLDLTKVTIK